MKRRHRDQADPPDASYPGLIAPASLKQVPLPHGNCFPGPYPGLIAPASLKRPHLSPYCPDRGAYPGLIAPASLKRRGSAHSPPSPATPYPGLIAPASLKPSLLWRFLVSPRFLSGAYSPGLIEAPRRCGHSRPPSALSGAYSPGLIEALDAAAPGSRAGRPYPGLIAPASLKHIITKPELGIITTTYPGLIAPASLKPTPSL